MSAKSILLIQLFFIALVGTRAQPATASVAPGRPVILGQLPDMTFVRGVAQSKRLDYSFVMDTAVVDSNYAIFAGPSSAGIVVEQTYGEASPTTAYQASFPYVTGVGPSGQAGITESRWIIVKVASNTPAGIYSVDLYKYSNSVDDQLPEAIHRRSDVFTHTRWIGSFNVYVGDVVPTSTFTVTSGPANTAGASISLDNPLINGSPYSHIFVTHNRNPGAARTGATDNPRPVHVEYSAVTARWKIVNSDGATMPLNVSFNVHIDPLAAQEHTSTSSNTFWNYTCIDNPILNENPAALAFITAAGGTSLPRNIGVYYSTANKKWCIFNQDVQAMPLGVQFNVKAIGRPGVSTAGSSLFETFVQSGNVTGSATRIARTSTNEYAPLLFVTQTWNPNGTGGTYNPHPVGVSGLWFGPSWSIYNEDGAAMPATAAFNVWEPAPAL